MHALVWGVCGCSSLAAHRGALEWYPRLVHWAASLALALRAAFLWLALRVTEEASSVLQ